jgi:hypothetical protein
MNEQDFVTDEEIDEMYGEAPPPQMQQQAVQGGLAPVTNMGGVPVYPLSLAQVPPAPATDSILTRKVGPLPVWGWALTALGVGVGGYFLWQTNKKVSKNDGGEDDDAPRSMPEDTETGREGWGPSRGTFCGQLSKHFMRKGMSDRVKIFDDADAALASGKFKTVSPLINIKCDGTYKPDKDLVRLCKREGLNPIVHEDGSIGLYPATSGKRAAEWEKYIDLLRDDGQKV